MASQAETKFIVTRLNGSNYQTWKFKLEMLLSKDDLWEIVNEDRPVEATPNWCKRDRQAKATISLLVEDDQLIHIRKENTARGMWLALQRLHERSNLSSKLYLLRKIYKMRLEKDQSMREHISAMLETVEQLRGLGEEMKDNHVAALLLCSLPESFCTLITALEARPEAELTLELVRGKLMDEFNRRKEISSHHNTETESALKAYNGTEKHIKKETRSCYYCKKQGHLKTDCRKWKADREKQNSHKAKKAVKEDVELSEGQQFVSFKATDGGVTNGWFIDSGATSHMTSNKEFFSIFDANSTERIYLADGKYILSKGIGEGFLECKAPSGATLKIHVQDVQYVPTLEGSLLSVRRLTDKGYTVEFKGDVCVIKRGEEVVIKAKMDGSLYRLTCHERANAATQQRHDNCIHLWHRRMGHRDPDAVKELQSKGLAEGIEVDRCDMLMQCVCCIKGKFTQKPFPKASQNRSTEPMQLIHSDICGPMKTVTPSGNRYLVTFIDDYSRYSHTYLVKQKSELLDKLKEFVAVTSNKYQRKPGAIRTDNGGEYVSKETKIYLREQGIEHQMTVPFTPQQNGVAERKNRSLTEMARCMLIDSNLDRKYWGEAVMTATYLQNRLPSKSIDKTPYELWHGKKPDLTHIRVFGSKAYYYVPKKKRTKLDDRALEGILVGYGPTTKGYRILDPNTERITMSRSAWFDEGSAAIALKQTGVVRTKKPNFNSNARQVTDGEPVEDRPQVRDCEVEITESDVCQEENNLSETQELRRSERPTKGIPPQRLSYTARTEYICEPSTWEDVMEMAEKEKRKWIAAASEEIESLHHNDTWELTEVPEGRKAIGCKWIFKIKHDRTEDTPRYKARLVAKGYSQKFGEDYDETFAPVVKHETVRVLFSVAAARKMKVRHYDVKTAFLHGELSEDLYMEQPHGFVQEGEEHLVCKLKKSIYGLKQSARAWNKRVNEVLVDHGFKRSKADPCLYSKEKDDSWVYVLLYVDDLLVFSREDSDFVELEMILNEQFETKDLGEASYYLGIQIEREDDGSYSLHQSDRIQRLLKDFGMEESKSVLTPMETEYPKLTGEDDKLPNNTLYRKAIGTLLYIATVSRPDIAATVGFLCRRVAEPRTRDWTAVKRVMRYLKGTTNVKLRLPATAEPKLVGYVDADWAGDNSDRKSTSGYLFQFGGGSVSWSSRKQSTVALSTTEAEYVAAAHASQEAIWLRMLLEEVGIFSQEPTKLMEDNQGCIKLALTERSSARTKHIDVKHHLLRDLQEQDIIKIEYCPTEEMTADMLTKPLARIRLQYLMKKANLTWD